jgi:hypothetical protein
MTVLPPPRIILFTMAGTQPTAFWTDDALWADYPYQWTTTLYINAQPHGSPNTPTPYFYDGNDVLVGDYVLTSGRGRILKIIAIASKSSSEVICTLEDENRTNILIDSDQLGDGGIPDGEGILFTVENGWPILHPLPDALVGTLPPYFASDVIARFMRTRIDAADQKGEPGGLASLDAATGKIPANQIPSSAITETFSIASEAAMLALDAQIGDIAIRTDVNKTFILAQADASALNSWFEVLTPGGNLSTLSDVSLDETSKRTTLIFNPDTQLWEDTSIDTLLDGGGF